MKLRRALAWLLAALSTLIAAEVAGRVGYRIWAHRWLSFEELGRARRALATGEDRPPTVWGEFLPHPYIGYVSRHWPDRMEEEPHPEKEKAAATEKKPDRIVVGVFGGSVAWLLGRESTVLLEELTKALTGKKIEVVTAALSGAKQPQELYALSYLMLMKQHFDVVILIDGYNELVNGMRNYKDGVFPPFPFNYPNLLSGYQTPSQISLIGEITILEDRQRRLAGGIEGSFLRHSAAVNLIWALENQSLALRTHRLQTRLQDLSQSDSVAELARRGPASVYPDDASLARELIRVWQESSVQMSEIARADDIVYIHFLQPNQYVEGSKVLSSDELHFAHDQTPPGDWVKLHFPEMRAAGKELRRRQVDFVDLTSIFHDVKETVYRDPCCHVNQAGNRILARVVAREVAARLSAAPRVKSPATP